MQKRLIQKGGSPQSKLHHWFPTTLAGYWADNEGMVSVVRPDGVVDRAPAGTYGAITHAHTIRLGGPWNESFEPRFNTADSEIDSLVEWVLTLEASTIAPERGVIARLMEQPLPEERQRQLVRCIASLVARSPGIRHRIRTSIEIIRRQIGFREPQVDKNLTALNQRGLYDAYSKQLAGGGRWAVLISDNVEFIFGDGIFQNFDQSGNPTLHPRCILHLTPVAALVYQRPTRYPTEPRLVTLRVTDDEARYLNGLVQVYSKEFLFFRSQQPELLTAFKMLEHRKMEGHGTSWLDGWLDDIAQYHLKGPGGTPSRSRPQQSRVFIGDRA